MVFDGDLILSVQVETRIILKVGEKEFNLSVRDAHAVLEALEGELKPRKEEKPAKPEWERASPTSWRRGGVIISQKAIGSVSSALTEWKTRNEIAKESNFSKSTVGHALRFLRDRGLALERREGHVRSYIRKELWRPNRGEIPKIEAVENRPALSAMRREEKRRREAMRER